MRDGERTEVFDESRMEFGRSFIDAAQAECFFFNISEDADGGMLRTPSMLKA